MSLCKSKVLKMSTLHLGWEGGRGGEGKATLYKSEVLTENNHFSFGRGSKASL